MLSTVIGHALDHVVVELLPIGSLCHIDEVDDDDASQVSQPHLTSDLLSGREIDIHSGVLLLRGASSTVTTIDIDDVHRLGLLYVQVGSLTVGNDLTEEVLDLASDVEVIKDGITTVVKPHNLPLTGINEIYVVCDLPHHALIIDIHLL